MPARRDHDACPATGHAPDASVQPARRHRLDWSILFFLALCLVSGALSWWLHGTSAVVREARDAGGMIVAVIPQLTLGILIAAFAQVAVPREKVGRLLGEQSGLRGLALASVFGAVMPGGPFASFPLVYALARSGADMGCLMAFLIAWATISVNRLLVWEIPFMGFEFGLLRFVSSLPLPLIAGLSARAVCRAWPGLRLQPGETAPDAAPVRREKAR